MTLALGGSVMYCKFRVLAVQRRITECRKTCTALEEEIRTLEAQWAELTRVERIDKLSKKLLHLEPLSAGHITSMDQVKLIVEGGAKK